MKYKNQFSKKFMDMFLKHTFKIYPQGWLKTLIWWTIDSKARTRKRIDTFLKEQLENPPFELELVASKLRGKDSDTTIINILKYVKGRTIYKSDLKTFKMDEYWATAKETWDKMVGDCDDFNSLIYILARLAGISQIAIWNILGDTANDYHYYCVYYSPSKGNFYAIDGTYWVSLQSLKTRPPFRLSPKKYTKIDYLFNEDYIYKPR